MPIGWVLVLVILVLFVLYGPLAELFFHFLHMGSVTRGSELARELSLTFDDGPDPVYTPALLQLLSEHDAKAVFFLVGQKVRQHPELVRQIHAQGHVIGNHTEHHKNGWFVTPWTMRREIAAASEAISAITGERVLYFRPPWGRFNLWQRRYLARVGMTPVLWTFAGKDWRAGEQAKAIEQILLAKAQSGGIVLLHDSGGAPGAPGQTIKALRSAIPRLQAMGFSLTTQPVTLARQAEIRRKGSFPRLSQRIIHPIWRRWDQLFDIIYRVYPMSRMFRLSVVDWRFGRRVAEEGLLQDSGAQAVAPHAAHDVAPQPSAAREAAATLAPAPAIDGADHTTRLTAQAAVREQPKVLLDNGMPLVELHLQNLALQELVKISPPEKMAIRGLREVRDSLREVALSLVFDDRYRKAHGVFGMTMIHRGMEKLGFHVEDVPPTLFNRWVTVLLTWIMVLYHPEGRLRLRHGLEEMHPRLMWMTRDELLARYLPEEARQQAVEAGLL